MLALPATTPRRPVRADGPVGGVPGDLWDTAEQLRLGTLSVDDIVARAMQRIDAPLGAACTPSSTSRTSRR